MTDQITTDGITLETAEERELWRAIFTAHLGAFSAMQAIPSDEVQESCEAWADDAVRAYRKRLPSEANPEPASHAPDRPGAYKVRVRGERGWWSRADVTRDDGGRLDAECGRYTWVVGRGDGHLEYGGPWTDADGTGPVTKDEPSGQAPDRPGWWWRLHGPDFADGTPVEVFEYSLDGDVQLCWGSADGIEGVSDGSRWGGPCTRGAAPSDVELLRAEAAQLRGELSTLRRVVEDVHEDLSRYANNGNYHRGLRSICERLAERLDRSLLVGDQ